MFQSLEARSLDKAGVNEDICFHSGSAGTCPPLPQLSETISRHRLAADCSGRFLLLLSPSTPPSGLGKVLHRSHRCVANSPARSDSGREKIDTQREEADTQKCKLSVFCFFVVKLDCVFLSKQLTFVSGQDFDQYICKFDSFLKFLESDKSQSVI